MSQIITRGKRKKTSQEEANSSTRRDSELNSVTKNPENDEKLPCIVEEACFKNVSGSKPKKLKTSQRVNIKTKISSKKSLIPPKKIKIITSPSLSDNDHKENQTSPNFENLKRKWSPAHSSLRRSEKSLVSFRNSKLDIFNNITSSFMSSKILSLEGSGPINTQKRLKLSNWGLPKIILEKYEARGIRSMFPWQVECLAKKNILENNKNLVYSAPTSAGKTLVAELLLLKTVLERRKKAIFILPFVSVVREKMFYFQDLLSDSGVRVEGFMGGVAPAGGFSAVHIAIATIEKANSIINRLMEENELATLGAVVIDELHLLGDPGRGYILELLLTKLRYMSLNLEDVNIQLIGMSATLPNLSLIADWLDAELYKTDFRPIPLNEQCKIGSSIHDSKMNFIRELEPAPDIVDDNGNIIQLCIETIGGGHGTLIFCPTKNWCEKLAIQMASTFFQLGSKNTRHGQILKKNIELTAVQEVLAQLERSPVGLDSILKKTVSFGVAFHHAGLTMDERDIIEGGFRVGSIKVLIATSTLSSGVNLPARRVIIRSPMFNGRCIDRLTYQQMIGRAGRMGKDTAGESILICKQTERAVAIDLMSSSLEPIVSCLEDSGPLIRALLEAVASQIVKTQIDLNLYCNCTFVYKCEQDEVKNLVEDAIQFLISHEFLLLKEVDGVEQRMVATCLGKACLSASISPRDGIFLFEELQRARKCFVLDTELHVVYLVTPFNSSGQINQIDWMIFMDLWRNLSESERRVGQLVGVEERFILTSMRGVVKPGKSLNIHRRFFTALALHDLVREISLNAVCKKYKCCRGLLQSLQQSSSTFAGMVTNFCKELKWDCMELLFAQFQARLQFGVCRDLLDLLRLSSLNGLRARSLFKHGITNVAELAVANEFEVEEALNRALPFESEKDFDGEHEAEVAKKNKMRTVFITGKDGMTASEAALVIIQEARDLVKNELGVRDVKWSQICSGENSSRNPNSPSINNQINLGPASMINSLSSRNISPISNKSNLSLQNNHSTSRVDREEKSNYEPAEVNIERPVQVFENVNDASTPKNDSKKLIVSAKLAFENEKKNSNNSEISSTFDEDEINESDKPEIGPRKLRSKLAEKTKSLIKDHFTICSRDFKDSHKEIPSGKGEKNLSKIVSRPEPSKFILEEKNKTPRAENLENIDNSKTEKLIDCDKSTVNNEKNLETDHKVTQSKSSEKTQILKDDIYICTMDFQDSVDCENEKMNRNVSNENIKKTSEVLIEDKLCSVNFRENTESCAKNSSQNSDIKNIELKKDSESLENASIKEKRALLEKQFSICTQDFDSKIDSKFENSDNVFANPENVQGSSKNKVNIEHPQSPKLNNSVQKNIVKETETEEYSFPMPAPVTEVKDYGEPKRSSGGGNYSKSPSLFSDSSFLDGQLCSILEQNIIEGSCLADFEKTDLTPGDKNLNKIESFKRNSKSNGSITNLERPEKLTNIKSSTPVTTPSTDLKNVENKKIDENISRKMEKCDSKENLNSNIQMTWVEDSWDQTKNIVPSKSKVTETNSPVDSPSHLCILRRHTRVEAKTPAQSKPENSVSDSPSLLCISRRQTRLRTKALSQSIFNDLHATTSKEKISDSPLRSTPKSILRKRVLDNKVIGSPVAAVRTYNVTKPILPNTPSSNKSDSEDSIVNSQNISGLSRVNKTRIRIEQKFLSTQKKLRELESNKNSSPKFDRDSVPMLVKQNSEPIFDDSTASNSGSESDTMFDSDEEEKSTQKKMKKSKIVKPVEKVTKLLKYDSLEDESLTLNMLQTQDVTKSKRSFQMFCREIFNSAEPGTLRTNLAIALVMEPINKDTKVMIGNKIIGVDEKKKNKKMDTFVYGCKKICGIVISWGVSAIHYVPFYTDEETRVTLKEKMNFLKKILTNSSFTIRCFNAKEIYKILYSCCGIESCCNFLDPKIGDWMINTEFCNKSYTELTAQYYSKGLNLAQNLNNSVSHDQLGTVKASAKAVLAWYTTEAILNEMKNQNTSLITAFRNIEMPTNIILANLELRGCGMNLDALKELSTAIKSDISRIEEKAFSLAGRKFNFNSSKDVALVLGLGKKGKTNKKALMSCENPISELVTLWRKLTTVLIKILYPLLHLEKKGSRIYGNYITRTVTGRVSMYDPNLQTIPRDFKSEISGCVFSARMAFTPIDGNVMLSADFCQLELRILAHYSKDSVLCKLMNEEGDIFKNIAARLNNVSEDMVNDEMRQRAKQLCYAMIYGMGTKSLAESLSVPESEAKDYLEAFMNTYKGIRKFLNAVSEQARIDGYVSTLTGRRRFLPGINSQTPVVKAQAERQAVNTKIQGSAADIAKKAMVLIEKKLQNEFSYLPVTLPSTQTRRNLRSSDSNLHPRGAYLLLQLHDELLYEVNTNDLQQVAIIVKQSMEQAFKLRVPLPVKVKVGPAWGSLEEYQI